MSSEEDKIEISGYEIKNLLGKGGMATVYLAIQNSFEREVAIKVMSEELSSDPSFGERFLREAKIVSQLRHPNIVTVYDVGFENKRHFLSMEYIHGVDLKERLHTISFVHLIKVMKEMASALDFAGRKGYVHRDIKPENIMICDEDGRSVLMDFGIAKAFETLNSMTQTGTAIGTPYYMSPEQAKGKALDWRSDLYSLGVVFYQVLVGELPYDGDSAISVGIKHISDPVPQLPEYLAESLQPIINKLLAKVPDERYQSGVELVEDINSIPMDVIDQLAEKFDSEEGREEASFTHTNSDLPITRESDRKNTTNAEFTTTNATRVINANASLPNIQLENEDKREVLFNKEHSLYKPVIAGVGVLVVALVALFFPKSEKDVLLEKAQLLEHELKGNIALAEKLHNLYGDVLKLDDDNPVALSGLEKIKQAYLDEIQVLIDNKLFNDAEKTLLKKLALFPELEQANHISQIKVNIKDNLALAELLNKINVQEASLAHDLAVAQNLLANYQKVIELDENNVRAINGHQVIKNAYRQRVNALIDNKKFDEAIALLTEKAAIFPEIAESEDFKSLQAKIDSETTVLDTLKLADEFFTEDRLTGEGKNNALYHYREVLKVSPNNKTALKGLENIVERYYQLAQEMLANNRLNQALSFTSRGLSIEKVDNEKLGELKKVILEKRVLAQRESKKQLQQIGHLLANVDALIEFGDLITPTDKNALNIVNEILEIESDNEEAKYRLTQIESKIISEIKDLAKEKKFARAEEKLATAIKAIPNNTKIAELKPWLAQTKELAIQADEPKLSNIMIKGESFSELEKDASLTFSADRTIFIGFNFSNFKEETTLLHAELFDGARAVKISTVPVILSGKKGEAFFNISRPVNGFPEGGYNLDLILQGNTLTTRKFSVEK